MNLQTDVLYMKETPYYLHFRDNGQRNSPNPYLSKCVPLYTAHANTVLQLSHFSLFPRSCSNILQQLPITRPCYWWSNRRHYVCLELNLIFLDFGDVQNVDNFDSNSNFVLQELSKLPYRELPAVILLNHLRIYILIRPDLRIVNGTSSC